MNFFKSYFRFSFLKVFFRLFVLFFPFVLMLSCVSYHSRINQSIQLLRKGKSFEAASLIKELAEKPGKDQLVYLLDYATLLQAAKQYEKSVEAFLKAEQIAEIKDYYSLSRISSSILLNEAQVQYKGEDYEKLLIHVMLAINFLILKKEEAALVETRKINEKLYQYKHEAKKNYEQNVFAYYLAGLIWESDKKWEDAYLDYKMAYQLDPNISYLKEDLVRVSALAEHWPEHKKWKKKFNIQFKKEWKDPLFGELILIFQQGRGPKKRPHPDFVRVPKLFPSYSYIKKFLIEILDDEEGLKDKVPQKVETKAEKKIGQKRSSFFPSLVYAALEVEEKTKKTKSNEKGPHRGVRQSLSKDQSLSKGLNKGGNKKIKSFSSEKVYSVQDIAIKTLNDKYSQLIAKRIAGILAKEVLAHELKKQNEALGLLLQLGLHLSDQADLRQWSTLPETFQVARLFLKEGTYKIKGYGLNAMGEKVLSQSFERVIRISRKKKHFYHWRSVR